MRKKNIVIVGYPKSGTTWLSRLVAELIQCPLQGDWGFNTIDALFKEGEDRESPFDVYKTHHTNDKIKQVSDLEIYQTIYIVRDPRDVTVSGIHYFDFLAYRKASVKKWKLGLFKKVILKEISEEKKKKLMIAAVLKGDKRLNKWLATSWYSHLEGFQNTTALIIRYEDLQENPFEVSKQLLNFLGAEKDETHIIKSIKKQSFGAKQKELKERDHPTQNLMRKGKQGDWKKQLTRDESQLFTKVLTANTYYQL